ncbi:MAG: sugar phosphate nucleotidyltransferase, partial [Bacteroidota bacterium]
MKAILPVAGVGKRLRPLTYSQPKPLIPLAGKPIISFIIDQLMAVGVDEFVFIIGFLGDKIEDYVREAYPDLQATFVTQEDRLGPGHAIWLARETFKEEESIIIFFGDVIVDADLAHVVNNPKSTLVVKKVKDPRQFGVVEMKGERLHRLVEKPKIPKSDLAMVGIYKIADVPTFLEGLHFNIERGIQTNDSFQLTDALMRMVEREVPFDIFHVNNWFDCGQPDVLLATNAIFLDRAGLTSEDIAGTTNTVIVHPVRIGPGCEITNSIIGPHVTIGEKTTIK